MLFVLLGGVSQDSEKVTKTMKDYEHVSILVIYDNIYVVVQNVSGLKIFQTSLLFISLCLRLQ